MLMASLVDYGYGGPEEEFQYYDQYSEYDDYPHHQRAARAVQIEKPDQSTK